MPYYFPFGQELHPLVQEDKSPKKIFVLGVYASAVKSYVKHLRWQANREYFGTVTKTKQERLLDK